MADTSLVFDILTRGGKESAAEFLTLAAAEDKAGQEADRLAGRNDKATLSARKMALSVQEAADSSARAQKKAADASEQLAKGEITEEVAAQKSAEAARELERAKIKVAEASRAAAAAAQKVAKEELEAAAAQKASAVAAKENAAASVEEAAAQKKVADFAKQSGKNVSLLRLALLAVAPAAVPAIAATVVGVAGLGAAVVGAGLGVAGFAAIAKSQFSAVKKATQQVTAAQQAYTRATTDKARKAALVQEKAALQALTPVQRKLYDQTNDLKKAWVGVQKQLGVPVSMALIAWMGAAKKGMALLAPVVRPVAAALKDLGDSAATALGSPYWHNFFTLVGGIGGHAVSAFGTILGNLAKGFAGLLTAFSPVSSKMIPALTLLSAKFAAWGNSAKAAGAVQKLIDYVAAKGPQLVAVVMAAGPALVNMSKALAGMGGASLSGITVILEVIGKMSPGQLQALAVGFFAIKAGLAGIAALQGIVGLVNTIQDLALAQRLASVATTLWTGAMWLLDAAMDANPVGIIILAIVGLIAAIVVVVKYHKQLAQAAVAAWHGIEYVAKAAWQGITSFFSGAWNMVSGPVTAAWRAVASVTMSVFNGILGFFQKWWPLLLVVFAFPIAFLMSAWNHLHQGMEAAVKLVWNGISAFLGMIWNGIKTLASLAWAGIKAAIINPIKSLVNWLTPAWNGIARDAGRGWHMVYNAMIGPIVSGVKYISSQVGKLATIVWNAVKSAYNKVKGVGSWFTSIGRAIVSGIINGVWSGASGLYNTLRNLANNALNAAKSFLGINSPSKLFAQVVGLAIPEGVAKGVSDNTHLAVGAVKTMSDALVPTGSPLGASTTGATAAGRSGAAVVRIDVSGADSEMKRMVRKWVRVEGGGDVQVALGG